jgi:branched-chain amino acid transport system ATP-binding protein
MSDLIVETIDTYYARIKALDQVSIRMADGESVAVLGANGAGKTTLLRSICGATPPRTGKITYGGRNLRGRHPHEIVRLGIVYVPEGRRILTRLTVKENLLLGASVRKDGRVANDLADMLEAFPALREKLNSYAGDLSGGQQQMLAIARGLMARPQLVLLDEPSLGLSPLLVEQVTSLILNARSVYNISILIVEQNVGVALDIADRGYVLQNGRVVHEGTCEALTTSEAVWRAYLGTQPANGSARPTSPADASTGGV